MSALFAVLALIITTLAFPGETQACPSGIKADGARSLAHNIKAADAASMKTALAANHVARVPSVLGGCCGGSHVGGSTCQDVCSSCVAALAVTSRATAPAADTVAFGLSGQDALSPATTLLQFRPPRRTA